MKWQAFNLKSNAKEDPSDWRHILVNLSPFSCLLFGSQKAEDNPSDGHQWDTKAEEQKCSHPQERHRRAPGKAPITYLAFTGSTLRQLQTCALKLWRKRKEANGFFFFFLCSWLPSLTSSVIVIRYIRVNLMLFLKVKKIEIRVSSTAFAICLCFGSQYCYWSVVDIHAHIMCAKCNLDAPGQQMQHMAWSHGSGNL